MDILFFLSAECVVPVFFFLRAQNVAEGNLRCLTKSRIQGCQKQLHSIGVPVHICLWVRLGVRKLLQHRLRGIHSLDPDRLYRAVFQYDCHHILPYPVPQGCPSLNLRE